MSLQIVSLWPPDRPQISKIKLRGIETFQAEVAMEQVPIKDPVAIILVPISHRSARNRQSRCTLLRRLPRIAT